MNRHQTPQEPDRDGAPRRIRTAEAVESYLNRLEGQKSRSPVTIQGYRTALEKLIAVTEWLPCTEDDVTKALMQGNMGKNTKAQTVRIYRRFFDDADRRYGVGNPARSIEGMTEDRPIPRILTDDELSRLVSAAQALSHQDYLLVLIILDTGIRVGEVFDLRTDAIRDRWLYVNGKTGERPVPITPETAELLLAHAVNGVIWRGPRSGIMSKDSLRHRYRAIFEAAGITGKRCGPHTLRHTYATKYIEHGGNVVHLQQILGHKNISMTLRYVNLAGRAILESHQLYSLSIRMGLVKGVQPTKTIGTATQASEPFVSEILLPSNSNQWLSDFR